MPGDAHGRGVVVTSVPMSLGGYDCMGEGGGVIDADDLAAESSANSGDGKGMMTDDAASMELPRDNGLFLRDDRAVPS